MLVWTRIPATNSHAPRVRSKQSGAIDALGVSGAGVSVAPNKRETSSELDAQYRAFVRQTHAAGTKHQCQDDTLVFEFALQGTRAHSTRRRCCHSSRRTQLHSTSASASVAASASALTFASQHSISPIAPHSQTPPPLGPLRMPSPTRVRIYARSHEQQCQHRAHTCKSEQGNWTKVADRQQNLAVQAAANTCGRHSADGTAARGARALATSLSVQASCSVPMRCVRTGEAAGKRTATKVHSIQQQRHRSRIKVRQPMAASANVGTTATAAHKAKMCARSTAPQVGATFLLAPSSVVRGLRIRKCHPYKLPTTQQQRPTSAPMARTWRPRDQNKQLASGSSSAGCSGFRWREYRPGLHPSTRGAKQSANTKEA